MKLRAGAAAVRTPLRTLLEHRRCRLDLRRAVATLRTDEPDFDGLAMAWGNELFRADADYLRAIYYAVRETEGRVLECGSGISTLLLSATVPGRITTLEHSRLWAAVTRHELRKLGLKDPVVRSPLTRHAAGIWYDTRLSDGYSVIVCDGPPGHRGGRGATLPIAIRHMTPKAVVLLDDVERPEERTISETWADRYGFDLEIVQCARPYAVLSRPRVSA
jgi:predicted O-methyltransferase YrrM